jgi:putative acetyltransferase
VILGRLSLETGSVSGFEPAVKLYEGFGFQRYGAFADHPEYPYSVFMTLAL